MGNSFQFEICAEELEFSVLANYWVGAFSVETVKNFVVVMLLGHEVQSSAMMSDTSFVYVFGVGYVDVEVRPNVVMLKGRFMCVT